MNETTKNKSKYAFLTALTLLQYYFIESFFYAAANNINSEFVKENPIAADAILCMFMLIIFAINYKLFVKSPRSYIKKADYLYSLIIVLGIGGVSFLWLTFADEVLGKIFPLVNESIDRFDNFWPTQKEEAYIWSFLSIVFLGPIFEELIFRGLIFNYAKKISGPIFAIIFSGIIFGVWHGEFVQAVYTAVMGMALAIVYYKTGSLLLCFILHIFNNLISTLPAPLDTDIVHYAINTLSMALVLPALCLLYRYFKEAADRDKYDKIDVSETSTGDTIHIENN